MQHRLKNWDLLRPGAGLDADIHILCEATKPPTNILAVGYWRTIGLAGILRSDRPVKREWSTAVAARTKPEYITNARVAREYRSRPLLPFKPSRPGTWTAARVKVGRVSATAVALYGLLDERSDASIHRSLSELSPIFDHPSYRRNVLLGGDFNIFANPRPEDPSRRRHLAVLERLEAYGLVNCLTRFPSPRPTADKDPCPCGERMCRRHWRTFRRSPASPGPAWQEDYLFASQAMAARLESCEVLPFRATSDHAPILARFAL